MSNPTKKVDHFCKWDKQSPRLVLCTIKCSYKSPLIENLESVCETAVVTNAIRVTKKVTTSYFACKAKLLKYQRRCIQQTKINSILLTT